MVENRKNVVVFGATSKIVHESLKKMSLGDKRCHLFARNSAHLNSVARDLQSRFPESGIQEYRCDFQSSSDVEMACKTLEQLGKIDLIFLGFGSMLDENVLRDDTGIRDEFLKLNVSSVASLLMSARKTLLGQGSGTLCVITSVAGDRGRASNYLYGSTKAFTSTLLSGLWHELSGSQIKIIDVRPGITETPMTSHLKNGLLTTSASRVGAKIARSVESGRSRVVYTPGYWGLIMCIVRNLPDFVFKKLKF